MYGRGKLHLLWARLIALNRMSRTKNAPEPFGAYKTSRVCDFHRLPPEIALAVFLANFYFSLR
jgi:hypothetical protein